jgi:hypothetical protein
MAKGYSPAFDQPRVDALQHQVANLQGGLQGVQSDLDDARRHLSKCCIIFMGPAIWGVQPVPGETDRQRVLRFAWDCWRVDMAKADLVQAHPVQRGNALLAKGAFPPSNFSMEFTDTLSVTHSEIPKSVTFLAYLTETRSQTKMVSDRVSVADFSTSSRILEPFFAREIQTVFVTLLCLTDKLVYVETAELRYPSHLHHGRASVAESVSVN